MGSRNPNPVGVIFFELVKMLIVFFFDVVQCVHFFDDVNLCGAVRLFLSIVSAHVHFFMLCSEQWFAFNEVRTAAFFVFP